MDILKRLSLIVLFPLFPLVVIFIGICGLFNVPYWIITGKSFMNNIGLLGVSYIDFIFNIIENYGKNR